MGRLAEKCAVITGAGSGIGRAAAELFAAEGARVLAADRDAETVADTVERVRAAGGAAEAVTVDVSEERQVQDLMHRCVDLYGRLDIAFNNAGVSGGLTPILELTHADWTFVLGINLIGAFFSVKHAALIMCEQGGGSIINTASVAGLRASAGNSVYSASKAGVISLTQTAASQLAGTNVRVNCVCPGLTETGMTKPIFDLARARGTEHKIGQLNPLRRAAQPEEIAQVALFLASAESSYINGQAIPVDGGLSASHPFVPGRLA